MSNCDVYFEESNEFIIIPDFAIRRLIQAIRECNGSSEIEIVLEELMPKKYFQYIERVLNTNRDHHKTFDYDYIMARPIEQEDVMRIFSKQVKLLSIDGINCFLDVSVTIKQGEKYVNLTINSKLRDQLVECNQQIIIKPYN
ncbi:hypothetical protein [uncultured Vagococcus sp.]|uniref:hypothetical protein n=1 Tax=uncultured Vagococcus sp. TaxID=189676 RepID=UPI0028D2DF50|nr:hypothetical protein [uncultured Vagococcus sp.]